MRSTDWCIKLCRVGGIFWARQLAEMALAADLMLLGSGLTEGRIALYAGAAIFSAFGITMPVDLNGPQFLADDMVHGPLEFPGRRVVLSDRPGHRRRTRSREDRTVPRQGVSDTE